jgi:hypothetical protein
MAKKNPTAKDLKTIEHLEEEYGPAEDWHKGILEGEDFYSSFEAGRFHGVPAELRARLSSVVTNEVAFDKVFTSDAFGVCHTYESRAEMDESMDKDLDSGHGYFSGAWPDGNFDFSAFGFLPVDLRVIEANLNKLSR